MPGSGAARGSSEARSPRRAPSPERRQRDAARSRKRILDAAIEEFSTRGYAGARVADIADRAGVNVQLITYYFGGKQGLYGALERSWESEEAVFAAPEMPFPAVIRAYFDAVYRYPPQARLLIWQALGDGPDGAADALQRASMAAAVADIRRRQESGELSKDVAPAIILVVLWAAVMAPVTMPRAVLEACGADFDSPEFRTRFVSQLARLFAGPWPAPASSDQPGAGDDTPQG
jgi:AcrR family transcriptional regulator